MQHRLSSTRLSPLAAAALLLLVPALAAADGLVIKWDPNPEPEITGYMLYVGNAPNVYDQTFDVGQTTQYTFGGVVPGQRYCFAVAAYLAGPVLGERSTAVCWNNQTPTLTNPGDQTTGVGTGVNLTLVGTDPDGEPVSYSSTGLPPGLALTSSTGAIGGTPTTVGVYPVTVTVSDGTASTSQSFTWTIQASLPGAPTLLRPLGAISTNKPTFEWESVVSATSYRLWVDDASTTDPKIQIDLTPAQAGCATVGAVCQVSPGVVLAAGRASWSVRASNAAGAGPWSGASDFTVPDGAAPTVVISGPTTAATYSTPNATIALSGTATDDIAVTQVTWTNSGGGSGTATGTSAWSIPAVSLVNGTNTITVTARDGAGNSATDVLTVTRTDGQAPTLNLTAPTSGSQYSSTSSSISLGGTATDDVGVIRVTWASDRGGSGTATITTGMGNNGTDLSWATSAITLQPGLNTFTVTAFDAANNQYSKTLAVTLTDTAAPTVAITTPTASGTHSTTSDTVTIGGTAADSFGVTQVSWSNNQGGSGVASGTTAWSASGVTLKGGANIITVTARDAAGNVGSATLTVTLTDGAAPSISISTPTSATTYSTTASTLALGGTASDAFGVSQVTWATDKGASGVASGTTAWTIASVPLEAGVTVVTVTAKDAAGQTGTDVLTVTRTDGVPPAVDITSPAAGATFSTASTTIALSGSASDNVSVAQVTWSNDRGGNGVATGTTSWSVPTVSLQAGANVLTVTAKDAAGNTAVDVLTITLTDAAAPTIAIASPTAAETMSTTSATVSLGGTASDVFGVTEVRWANDRGGNGVATGTTTWSAQVALQQGANVITVTASDAAGNTATDKITITADSKGPTIAISTPSASGSFVANTDAVSIGGTAADEVGVTEVVWTNNRGGSGRATGSTNWTIANVALQNGVNLITVTARDAAGNSTNATLSVSRDSQAPTVEVMVPTSATTFVTNKKSVVLSGKAADNTGVTQVTWANNRGGNGNAYGTTDWSVPAITLLAGANVITVSARDAAGNSTTSSLTVTLDTRGPVVSIQEPWSGNVYQTTNSSVVLGGVASDDTGVVEVTWTNSQGGSGVASGTTAWTVPGVKLKTGFNELTVTAKDAAGNTSSEKVRVKAVDKNAPVVKITGPSMEASASVSVAVINVEGTVSDDFGVAQVAWANDRGGSGLAQGDGRWVAAGVTLQPGVNLITVTAFDGSGNSSSARIRIVFDRSLPTISITAPTAAGSYTSVSPTVGVSGVAADDTGIARVTWATDRGQTGVATGTSSWSIPSVNVEPGSSLLTVTAIDKSGNTTQTTLTLVRGDSSAPVVKIYTPTTAAGYTTTATTLILGGTASDDTTVAQVMWANAAGGSGAAYGTTSWSTSSMPLSVGANVITITARDASGNAGVTTITVTRSNVDTNGGVTQTVSNVVSNPTKKNAAPVTAPAPQAPPVSLPQPAPVYSPQPAPVSLPPSTPAPARNTNSVSKPTPPENRPADPSSKKEPQAPGIRILSPTTSSQLTISSAAMALSGTASHSSGIVAVRWSTDAGASGVAEGAQRWNIPSLQVTPGTTTLTVTAFAASGESASATLSIARRSPMPKLTVASPTTETRWTTADKTLTLRGTASESVAQILWSADSGASGSASGVSSWTISGVALVPGVNRITLTAQDAAGRTDRQVLTVTYTPQLARR